MESFFNKSIVPASDELEIPFPIPYKPRSPAQKMHTIWRQIGSRSIVETIAETRPIPTV